MRTAECASEMSSAAQSKQMSEWCVQTDKFEAQYLHLDSWLFWTIVQLCKNHAMYQFRNLSGLIMLTKLSKCADIFNQHKFVTTYKKSQTLILVQKYVLTMVSVKEKCQDSVNR